MKHTCSSNENPRSGIQPAERNTIIPIYVHVKQSNVVVPFLHRGRKDLTGLPCMYDKTSHRKSHLCPIQSPIMYTQ